ncbi:peptide ABC transporter permease, partial [Streptomyces sp. ZEA17I]
MTAMTSTPDLAPADPATSRKPARTPQQGSIRTGSRKTPGKTSRHPYRAALSTARARTGLVLVGAVVLAGLLAPHL